MKSAPDDESISQRTLEDIDAAVRNLDAGVVGDEFDLSEIADLLNEPCSVVEPDLQKDP